MRPHVVYYNHREGQTKSQEKEIVIMKYRVYNEKNYSERMGTYLAHYTKTKREAIEYGETVLGGNYTIEKKIASNWVRG